MRKTLLLILFISLFNCCQSDNELIGNWNSTNGYYIVEFEFHQDGSLKYFGNYEELLGEWKIRNSRIYIELIESEIDIRSRKFALDYELLGDSLFLKRPSEERFPHPGWIKFDNRFNQWTSHLGIRIDLNKSEMNLITSVDDSFSKEIYIGFKGNKIVSRIDDRFVSLNEDARNIAFMFSKQNTPETENKDLKFVLIIDKNIPEFKVDSIKNILRETHIKKIFRVYKNDSIDYHNLNWHDTRLLENKDIQWFGLYE